MSQIAVSNPQSYSKDFTFSDPGPDDDDSFETGIYICVCLYFANNCYT